jgi:hypothetical protein
MIRCRPASRPRPRNLPHRLRHLRLHRQQVDRIVKHDKLMDRIFVGQSLQHLARQPGHGLGGFDRILDNGPSVHEIAEHPPAYWHYRDDIEANVLGQVLTGQVVQHRTDCRCLTRIGWADHQEIQFGTEVYAMNDLAACKANGHGQAALLAGRVEASRSTANRLPYTLRLPRG